MKVGGMGNSLRRVLRDCLTAAMVERAEDCMRVGQKAKGVESKRDRQGTKEKT